MSFSQRRGLTAIRTLTQTDSIDWPLWNKLWNVVCLTCFEPPGVPKYSNVWLTKYPGLKSFLTLIWHGYFELTIDAIPADWYYAYETLKSSFFECPWYRVYDFLEFVAKSLPQNGENTRDRFTKLCNAVLTEEMSAYRFVGCEVVQITTEEEIAEVEGAMKSGGQFTPVAVHIGKALEHLADRKTPDYRNSIKEAISAVESAAKSVTGLKKATLDEALKELRERAGLHPALEKAFRCLYGYTSDADGIRHALMEETNVRFEDAKFMLVSCSAFVNYLISKLATPSRPE